MKTDPLDVLNNGFTANSIYRQFRSSIGVTSDLKPTITRQYRSNIGVTSDLKPTITRRIRIWEGKKCIMVIDLQGDTIVTRPNKKNLKVSYEAFHTPMTETFKLKDFKLTTKVD